jgi:hypothetical protein
MLEKGCSQQAEALLRSASAADAGPNMTTRSADFKQLLSAAGIAVIATAISLLIV